MTKTESKKLIAIHSALDAALGDSDPYIDDEMSDEDIAEQEPVFWAAKELAKLLGNDESWDE